MQSLFGAGPYTPTPVFPLDGYYDPQDFNRNALLSEVKLGSQPPGNALTVTYSFASTGSVFEHDYPSTALAAYPESLTGDQREAARRALDVWSSIANVDFVEVQETPHSVGVIRFARSEYADGAFTLTLDDGQPYAADIWLGPDFPSSGGDLDFNSYGYMGFVHEIGHALGLKHPFEPPRIMSSSEDWLGGTVMTYATYPGQPADIGLSADIYPDGPMLYDVDAIRFLYGTRAYATGDDIYRADLGARLFTTIVDDGGTDTLDWSNQDSRAIIDLRQGNWSVLGQPYSWYPTQYDDGGNFPGNVRTAFGTVIENANGGSAADYITGNGADNVLSGNAGNDLLAGGSGQDLLIGGQGNDLLLGQANPDRLLGLDGADRLYGADGTDALNGGALDDLLDGGPGNDELFGASGDDRLIGGQGEDRLYGSDGRDILVGGQGADILNGGSGDDFLTGNAGDDFLTGGTGRDRFVLGPDSGAADRITDFKPGIDLLALRGGYTPSQFLATASAIGGSTLFDLPGGHDVLVVGVTGAQAGWFGG